jgi:hypothetical protein
VRVAPDGTLILAYQDFTAPAHRLAVRRLAHGVWTPLTTAGAGSVGESWYNRLAFAPDGGLLVAARDYGISGALGVQRCARPGATWQSLGGPASPSDAHYTDLTVLPDGSIAVAFQDRSLSPADRTTVLVSAGDAWVPASGTGLGEGYCAYQSIAAAPDGSLLVSFTDGAHGGRATVLRRAPGIPTWTPLGGPGFTPDIPNNLVLRVAPDGTPYVAYYVWQSRIVVRRFDGNAWVQVGQPVDGWDVPTVETEFWRQWLAFEIDAYGRPVLAYQAANRGNRAVVKRWEAPGEWVPIGAEGFTPGAADYLALALAADGTPHVAFRDGTTGRALVMGWR